MNGGPPRLGRSLFGPGLISAGLHVLVDGYGEAWWTFPRNLAVDIYEAAYHVRTHYVY